MHFARLVLLAASLWLGVLGGARANPVLLVDMDTAQVLYAQDAGQPWHPASLTKLMTAFVTFEAIATGRVNLDTPVILSQRAINQAPSKSGLPLGSALSMKDALYVLLVKSANDMAVAIAETVSGTEADFVAEMNQAAGRLGLSATHFVNANGLHQDAQVTSARDLAVLALTIRQTFPQYMPIFATEAVQLDKAKLESNNDLLTHFAGTTGMKTGFVCASGLNIVATVERNGRHLMAVVLGASSSRERGEMTAELFLRGLSGSVQPTGESVLSLVNNTAAPPADMRPLICGKQANAYVAERAEAFPMGLKGQPSYLTDEVPGEIYVATNLGRLRNNIPLPRQRPLHYGTPVAASAFAPQTPDIALTSLPPATVEAVAGAPMPRPRLVR